MCHLPVLLSPDQSYLSLVTVWSQIHGWSTCRTTTRFRRKRQCVIDLKFQFCVYWAVRFLIETRIMIVTTSWMGTEVTQPLAQYLPKVLPSVIDVTKIHVMLEEWHTQTLCTSSWLCSVSQKNDLFYVVRRILCSLQEVHCNALLRFVCLPACCWPLLLVW